MAKRVRLTAASLVVALALAGCGTGAAAEGDGVSVVATHPILGDLVRNVAGDGVAVEVVMPDGADPHEFEPSAQQIQLVTAADLLVSNGLGFEEGLLDAIEAAEADGVTVLSLGEQLDPLPFAAEHAEDDEHEAGGDDPHWFQDPDRAAQAARLLGTALAEATGDPAATDRGEAYAGELEALAADMDATLAAVPPERRRLVTNHDAFGYFADRFDFAIVGTVIPSGTTLAEPSAGDLEALVEVIEREEVPAIFVEETGTTELADTLTAEVDTPVEVVELYSDSLGEPGSDGATYADLQRTNAQRIADALGS
jgi:zinc/manganese transport system substrate-binding protein